MDVREGELLVDRDELRVVLLADSDDLAATSSRLSRDAPSPPLHVHDRHADCFLVLDGALRLDLAGEERIVGPQSWIQVPRGVVHTFGAAGDGPATFVNVHTPSGGLGTYMRALLAARERRGRSRAWDDFDAPPGRERPRPILLPPSSAGSAARRVRRSSPVPAGA